MSLGTPLHRLSTMTESPAIKEQTFDSRHHPMNSVMKLLYKLSLGRRWHFSGGAFMVVIWNGTAEVKCRNPRNVRVKVDSVSLE